MDNVRTVVVVEDAVDHPRLLLAEFQRFAFRRINETSRIVCRLESRLELVSDKRLRLSMQRLGDGSFHGVSGDASYRFDDPALDFPFVDDLSPVPGHATRVPQGRERKEDAGHDVDVRSDRTFLPGFGEDRQDITLRPVHLGEGIFPTAVLVTHEDVSSRSSTDSCPLISRRTTVLTPGMRTTRSTSPPFGDRSGLMRTECRTTQSRAAG